MPDLLAHYLVAADAKARLANGRLADVLRAERDAFKVGAQGPDFFFYSHVWPGRATRGDLAFLVHQNHMSGVFGAMLGRAVAAPEEERAVITAFTCGYAAHLCLDAGAHPWILYWTGDVSAGVDSGEGAAARRRHGVLEASIDLTLSCRPAPDSGWIRRQRLLAMSPRQRRVLAKLWSQVMSEVFGVAFTAAEGRAAFRDMAFVYGSMTDRRSPLSRLLTALAPVIDGNGLLRTQIFPDAPHPTAAALLAGRRPWRSPAVPEEERTETFADILEAATGQAHACLEAVQDVVFGGGELEAALSVIGDRNMITGVPCGDPRPLVAFAPSLDQLWQMS